MMFWPIGHFGVKMNTFWGFFGQKYDYTRAAKRILKGVYYNRNQRGVAHSGPDRVESVPKLDII